MANNKGNSGNTNGGTETSFTKTPQAKDDALGTPQSGQLDYLNTLYILNVMSNDLGGNAKSLWSVDDGINDSGAMSGYVAGDLLIQDAPGVTGIAANRSLFGAALHVTADGRVAYDTSTIDATNAAALTGLALGETLTDSFIYAIRLANGTLSWAKATVVLTGVNDTPVVQNVSLAAIEDGGPVNGSFDGDDVDSDDDGSSLVYNIIGSPETGTLSNNGNGTFTYDPGSNFQSLAVGETADINLTYTATDKHGAVSAPADLAITVTGVNDAPTLAAGALGATEDGATVSLSLAALGDDIDSDDDGNTLAYSLLNTAAGGSASIAGTTLSFNPGSDFQSLAQGQTQSFDLQVRATDAHGATADNTVKVTVTGVNDVAVVQNVAVAAVEDGVAVTGSFDGDDVDSDDDANSLVYTIIGSPVAGTLTNNGNTTFTFAPGADFQTLAVGETTDINLTYTATDKHGAVSAPADLAITVTGVNDAPTLKADVLGAREDGDTVSLSLAALGDDIDSDDDGSTLNYSLLNAAAGGSAFITGTTLSFDPGSDFQALGQGETRSFDLQVQAKDAYGATATNKVTVTVNGVNDAPVINGGDSNGAVTATAGVAAFTVQQWINYPGGNYSLASIKSYTGSNPPNYTVTTNIIDYTDDPGGFAGQIPGSSPWPAATATGASGTGAAVNNTFVARITGQLVVTVADTYTFQTYNDDGVYLHVNNQLIINDPTLHPEQVFTGSIHLNPGVYPIELYFFEHGGEASLEFTYRNSSGTYSHVVAADKLGDAGVILFSDVDLTDAHTVSVAPNGATTGSLTAAVVKDTTGTGNGGQVGWNYSVDNKAVAYLGAGESITETFTVTVNDNKGGTAQQTVSVKVNGVNDAPVITTTTDQAKGNVMEDTTLTVSGQIGISDVDVNDTHTWSIASQTSGVYGSASVDGTGKWTYTLNNGTNGVASPVQSLAQGETKIETFTVRASDGKGGNADQIVHVVVAGINDAAVISSQSKTITETNKAESTFGALTVTDIDSPQAFNAANLVGNYGTLALNANGNWTYTMDGPHNEFEQGKNYIDKFNVSSVDGTTKVDAVTVTIVGTNDAPTAVNDSNSLKVTSLASQVNTTTVKWVDWTTATSGQVTGVIDLGGGQTIDVTYNGAYYFAQTSGGTSYFTPPPTSAGALTLGTGTYTSASVSNGPTGSDIIALGLATTRTLTFSQPVDDLFFAVVSLNGNGYRFDQDFDILSYGQGYWGNGGATKAALPDGRFELRSVANGYGQTELHGVIGIRGSVTSLTWDGITNEYWNGFTVGTYGKAQTAVAAGNLLVNDTDPENNPLTVTTVNGQSIVGNSLTQTLPSGARLTVNKNGTYNYDENGAFAKLGENETTTETFTYAVQDSLGAGSNTATVTLTVTGINDAPEILGSSDGVGAVSAKPPVIPFKVEQWTGYVHTHFNGNPATSLTTLQNYAANNTASYTAFSTVIDYTDDPAGFGGELAGSFRWPAAVANNATSASHPVNDNFFARITGQINITTADTYTFRTFSDDGVYLRVNGVLLINDHTYHGEIAQTGSIYLTPGQYPLDLFFFEGGGEASLELSFKNSSGQYQLVDLDSTLRDSGIIQFNDVDLTDSHTVSAVPVGTGNLGALTAIKTADTTGTGTGGQIKWDYSVNNDTVRYLGQGATKVESFTITVNDGKGGTDTQQVAVTITGINDGPVANPDTATVNEDSSVTINVLANDTDPDIGDTLSLQSAANGQNGTVTISGSNVIYTPSANFYGNDSFSYVMRDAAGLTSTASVNVTVNPVNDGPNISFQGLNIVNPSFESATPSGTAPSGWTTNQINYINYIGGWDAADGSKSLDLNAESGGGYVEQTLQTIAGATYTVGFALSKNPGSPGFETLRVSATGSAFEDYEYSESNSNNDMQWSYHTYTFTAATTNTTLRFASADPTGGTDAWGPALDDISAIAAAADQPTAINGLKITDIDSGSNPIQLNLSVANGTLSFNGLGLTAVDGNGSDGTLSYTGSLSDINAALINGLIYTPYSDFDGMDTLTATIDDLGATGSGGSLTDTVMVDIQVIGVPLAS